MDIFTLIVAILFIMLAIQYGQHWLAFAIVAVMIIAMRSIGTTVLLIIALIALYFVKVSEITIFWPIIIFGIIILALAIGSKGKGQQPEYYAPEGYGGLLEGM